MANDTTEHKLEQTFPAASAADRQRLCAFLDLLRQWSQVHNLTGSKSGADQLALACDCQALLDAVANDDTPVCDVGAGAGLPGMLLALLNPNLAVVLVEAEGSKAAFLEQVRIELAVSNVTIVHRRIEQWRPQKLPRLLCARGFARLAVLADSCNHLVDTGTRLLVLKARQPDKEIAELGKRHPRWKVAYCRKLAGAPSRYLVKACVA